MLALPKVIEFIETIFPALTDSDYAHRLDRMVSK